MKTQKPTSQRSWIGVMILCFLFGWLGMHRFYAGKPGSGLLYMFTFGLIGIGTIVDFFAILFGMFKDGQGLYIKN